MSRMYILFFILLIFTFPSLSQKAPDKTGKQGTMTVRKKKHAFSEGNIKAEQERAEKEAEQKAKDALKKLKF